MRFRVAVTAFLILAAAAVSAPAQERKGARAEELGSRPIEISADRLSADSMKNSVNFEGNVVATQGDVILHADRLFAEYTRITRIIEKIVAEGNVRVMQEDRQARAERGVFYNLEQRIVLSGEAEIAQGGNTVKGETVIIYLRENRSVVTGGEGGRVKAVIQPKSSPGAKEKPAP